MNDGNVVALTRRALVAQLFLARLLVPAKKAPTVAQVKRDLEPLFKHALSPGAWSELFDGARSQLIAMGRVQEKPLSLTAAGQTACLGFWRLTPTALSGRVTWQNIVRQVLVPRALDLPSDLFRGKQPANTLVLALLRRSFDLPADVRTQKDLLNALAWRQLGIVSTAAFTPAAVLGRRLLQTERTLTPAAVAKNLAKSDLIPSEKDLFRAVLQKWIASTPEETSLAAAVPADACSAPAQVTPTESAPSATIERVETVNDTTVNDAAAFVAAVRQATGQCLTGRFGDNKVFIAHVWRQLVQNHAEFSTTTLDEFKRLLLHAHQQQQVTLSRADLVERMDPRDVAESETCYLDARFHFLRV